MAYHYLLVIMSGYVYTHSNVYHELKHGNNGEGWTIMEVTRDGLNKNTRYKVKGIR